MVVKTTKQENKKILTILKRNRDEGKEKKSGVIDSQG